MTDLAALEAAIAEFAALLVRYGANRHLPDTTRKAVIDRLDDTLSDLRFDLRQERQRQADARAPRKALPFDCAPSWSADSNPLTRDWS